MKKLTLWFTFSLLLAVSACAQKPQQVDSKAAADEKNFYVLIETNYGDMTVKLYNETPLHRDNFVKLVREGFYDSTLFHRVINNFMIQGGDPQSKYAKPGQMLGNGGLDYRVPAEFRRELYHKKGALAAARDNNPQKASSSCQFYIVQGQVWTAEQLGRFGKPFTPEQVETYTTVGGTPHLDMDYTVFGELVEGMEVLDKIASAPTGPMDRPVEDVRMKMTLIEK